MTMTPDLHPWLRKYQWLIIAMTGLHMGASALNSIAKIQQVQMRLGDDVIPNTSYVTGSIFSVGIQGAAGFCLWLVVSLLMTSHSRAFRILLGIILTVYPCVCLMLPFNLVAGMVVIGSEIQYWYAERKGRGTAEM
jgi:hypothetical protein